MDKAEASKILGVKLDATDKDISAAHRSLMIANHPDKGGDPDKFMAIREAYEILKKAKA